MSKICISLRDTEVESSIQWCRYCRRHGYAIELRLDALEYSRDEIRKIIAGSEGCTVIASYSLGEILDKTATEEDYISASQSLTWAIIAGCSHVEIPYALEQQQRSWLMQLAWNYGCKVILAHYNLHGSESAESLRRTAEKCHGLGADIVKVVVTAHHPAQAQDVLSLYRHFNPATLMAFARGEHGQYSRFESSDLGAPFIYASPRMDYENDPGQPLFADFFEEDAICMGDGFIPCSSGLAARAIVMAALCDGITTLSNITITGQIEDAMEAARCLGATMHYFKKRKTLKIRGKQKPDKDIYIHNGIFHCGSDPLLAHMGTALGGLYPECVMVDGLLPKAFRPANNARALAAAGVDVNYSDDRLPLFVHGTLTPGTYKLDGRRTTELIAALIPAFALVRDPQRRPTTLVISKACEPQCILQTVDICRQFGLKIGKMDFKEDQKVITIEIPSCQMPQPAEIRIENSWSAAAMWLAAGASLGMSEVTDMLIETPQREIDMLNLMEDHGSDIGYYTDEANKNLCKFQTGRSVTFGFKADVSETPDLLGPLVVFALRCEGESVISGIHDCNGIHHNRAKRFCEAFAAIGANVMPGEKGQLIIRGSFDSTLKGGRARSYGDPGLAMALLAASLFCENKVYVEGYACIDRIWPLFADLIDMVRWSNKAAKHELFMLASSRRGYASEAQHE